MKQTLILIGCVAGLLLTPAMVRAESPLGGQMEIVAGAFKSLGREQDADKGAATAREAQEAVVKSLPLLPASVTKLPDPAAKAKAAAEFRLMMGRLYVTFCEIEQAFLAKDLAKVATLVDALKAHKKSGHARFMDEE